MAGGTTVGERTNGSALWPPSASICRAGQGLNTKWLPVEHLVHYIRCKLLAVYKTSYYTVLDIAKVF